MLLVNECSFIGIDIIYFGYFLDWSGFYNCEVGFLEDYIDYYEQIIIFNDGIEIVFYVDLSLIKLDIILIDIIEVYLVIKEWVIVVVVINYNCNVGYQYLVSWMGCLLEYFLQFGIEFGDMLLSKMEIKFINVVNVIIFQYVQV